MVDMILEHYTAQSFVLQKQSYDQPDPEFCSAKPHGLWVSVRGGYDWPTWCREQNFRIETLTHCTRIIPNADANILLVGPHGICIGEFEERYGVTPSPVEVAGFVWPRTGIDWRAVARDYDGIIITPYHWSDRLERHWYYSWDCASGCIWNTDVLALPLSQELV